MRSLAAVSEGKIICDNAMSKGMVTTMNRKIMSFLMCLILLFPLISEVKASADDNSYHSENSDKEILSIAEGIIAWKKSDNESSENGYLINEKFLELAGTTPGDWYPIGLGRLGIADNYEGYLAVIKDQIEERYKTPGKLSAAKATEWHRISLAVLAMGGDPTNIGTDENGLPINLIADGTYDRGKTTTLGRQGINGWIWGLITLDSMRYNIPEDAYYTRDDIIIEILRQQLSDGGFALSGKVSDPDITAMAVQALAPYYNDEKNYTYKQKASGEEVTRTVRQIIDEALACLSELQLGTGDFASWGTENVESTDQVVVALCCLGIDPLTDARFIKNGNTLLDGILRYRMNDGGFIHSFTYDPDNPTSLPDQSNTMASEQTLYTMAAIWRLYEGMRTLYDFRDEQSSALRQRISDLERQISEVCTCSGVAEDKTELEKLLASFYSIPENERCYVSNYYVLSDAAKEAGIDINEISGATPVIESPKDENDENVLLFFSESDRNAADSLPEKLTTEQYVLVVTLLDKLNKCEDFSDKNVYIEKLTNAKNVIMSIQEEIDSINADIKEKLYPFEGMSLREKKTVDNIVTRYNNLGEYDKTKIERWEDVIKTKTQLDNLLRGIIIGASLCIIAAVVTIFLIRRIRRKRRKKERELEELAQMYTEDE